jgi:hypothetical protein
VQKKLGRTMIIRTTTWSGERAPERTLYELGIFFVILFYDNLVVLWMALHLCPSYHNPFQGLFLVKAATGRASRHRWMAHSAGNAATEGCGLRNVFNS